MQSTQNTNRDITVVILSGGGSRRMQGRDKGMLPLRRRPMVQHVIERLSSQTGKILLSCNENCDNYRSLGLPLISDSLSGGLGPLAGLLSAMESADSEYIMCVPCDTPNLPDDLLARTCQTLEQTNTEACTVSDGQRVHPVFLLVSRHLQTNLRNYLTSGGRKVFDWLERLNHSIADFSDQPGAFININTPEQLQEMDKTQYAQKEG